MSAPVTVVARLHPAAESLEQATAAVRTALAGIRAEDGCLQYDPHLADDGSFVIVERWASREALAAHNTGAPVQVLRDGLAGLTTAPADVTIAEAL
ncbi:putative quinol monooxygenase [Agromyces sp. SYSU T00194]|uniref:putative quinol monooxygenase n=1 Tax=Agromyces chitinivorans TaxID=3158560 RepID=UPI003396F527